MKNLDISVIAPAHNEVGNIKLFCQKTYQAVKKITSKFEIIVVDDGSNDGTFPALKKIKKTTPQLKIIRLRRRFGQTAALMAGFNYAQGKIIITLDADLQQDPADIKKLIKPIQEKKADVVSGRRYYRRHSFIYRWITAVEYILNKLVLGISIFDTAVSPNAYRREVLIDLDLYGEMHRFLVPILFWRGYKVIEIKVSHHQRHSGQSKYKSTKAIRGFLDLLIVKFWQDYSTRPIHILGTIGLILIAIGLPIGIEEGIRKLVFHQSIINRTLPLFSAFTVILGSQFLVFGVLADVMIRIYYKNKQNYHIEKIIE